MKDKSILEGIFILILLVTFMFTMMASAELEPTFTVSELRTRISKAEAVVKSYYDEIRRGDLDKATTYFSEIFLQSTSREEWKKGFGEMIQGNQLDSYKLYKDDYCLFIKGKRIAVEMKAVTRYGERVMLEIFTIDVTTRDIKISGLFANYMVDKYKGKSDIWT